MAECPRCEQKIREGAVSCSCGWRARTRAAKEAPRPIVQCAHESCVVPATVRQKTPTGWANLCQPHYLRFHDELACRAYAEQGLERGDDETREEHKKRVFAWLKSHSRLKTFDAAQEKAA